MASAAHQQPINREARLPWIRTALFLLALLVSLLLHAALLHRFPHWLPAMEWGPDPSLASKPRPLVMGEIRSQPDLPSYLQPDKFRPESPEAFADVEPLQRTALDELRAAAAVLDVPTAMPVESRPPEIPADDPELAEARRSMIQIEQQLAAAELAALPRVVVPALPRIETVPDVTMPATAEAIAEASTALHGMGAFSFQSLDGRLTAYEPSAMDMLDVAVAGAPTEETRLQEQTAILDETTTDITDIQPIEQLLAVTASTYRDTAAGDLYFELSITRAGVDALPVIPKDVLIVQDCSESITRAKLEFFKDGIVKYLRTLTTVDRLNIMRYSDTPVFCFDDWQPVTEDSLQTALRFTRDMRVRGQTDLFSPLQQVLKLPRHPSRPMLVLLLTDGRPTMGVMDSSDIILRFSKANHGAVSIFAFGGGEHVNSFLLDLLGHNNRGGSWIVPRREQIPGAVERAARELARPVLINLDYRFSGDSTAEVYPAMLTHLYLDRPLKVWGRCPLDQSSAVFRIAGRSGTQEKDMVFALDLADAEDGGEGIRREWVAQKIYKLFNDHMISGREETMQEIRDLSNRYNVILR